MLRFTRSFQLNSVRRYIKPAIERLQHKIDKNQVSRRYEKALEKFEGRILFNSILDIQRVRLRKLDTMIGSRERRRMKQEKEEVDPLPMVLNQLYDNAVTRIDEDQREVDIEYKRRYQKTVLPFSRFLRVNYDDESKVNEDENEAEVPNSLQIKKIPKNWLSNYEVYDEAETELPSTYGSPDIHFPTTNVQCHGCGALLHCKE